MDTPFDANLSLLMRAKAALRSRVFVIKLILYSAVVLVAICIDYRDVVVLESGYTGFSIFDFFFYQPFDFFFQWVQLGALILIHHFFGKGALRRAGINILVSVVEVVVSCFVFFMIAMISHGYWGGPF